MANRTIAEIVTKVAKAETYPSQKLLSEGDDGQTAFAEKYAIIIPPNPITK